MLTGSPSPPSTAGALTASVVKTITLPGSGADAIAIDSGVAYVVGGGAQALCRCSIWRPTSWARASPLGATPVAMAVDQVLHTAYVANAGAGTVSVIDEASASVVATVPVGAKPVAIAIDSTRHVAYVVNNAANSVSILDETTNHVTGHVAGRPGTGIRRRRHHDKHDLCRQHKWRAGEHLEDQRSYSRSYSDRILGRLPLRLTHGSARNTLYVEASSPLRWPSRRVALDHGRKDALHIGNARG